MKYAYEDLSEDQFEKLVVLICQELLGMSTQGFAKGPDGGRDGKFTGTAQLHPSKASPWIGTTIIQAKHTNGYNRSFSELDFHSDEHKATVLGEELPRIKNLRSQKLLDHYMLFSNRRLTGNAESKLVTIISGACGIPKASIYICGVEQLEMWLKKFPQIPALAEIDPTDSPLQVGPEELAEVVEALARQLGQQQTVDDPPTPRVLYEKKNALNNMTAEYAKDARKRYLKETAEIHAFLSNPDNADLLRLYESVIDEFQQKIIAKRKNYQTFDEVMNYLTDLLLDRDAVLRQRAHKRLTRAMLFYMYWNCDIGLSDDATTH